MKGPGEKAVEENAVEENAVDENAVEENAMEENAVEENAVGENAVEDKALDEQESTTTGPREVEDGVIVPSSIEFNERATMDVLFRAIQTEAENKENEGTSGGPTQFILQRHVDPKNDGIRVYESTVCPTSKVYVYNKDNKTFLVLCKKE